MLGVIAPYPRIAIGLQLHADGESIGFGRGSSMLEASDLFGDAEQILHMMANLMRDHVGLSKVSGSTEAMSHVIKEREIEIYFMVARTIEGSDCGRCRPAGGTHRSREQDQP